MSYFTHETFASSMHKYCSKSRLPDACFVNEIVDLIIDNFGQDFLQENESILNSLISDMVTRESSACFIKLTNLGAIVNDDYNFIYKNVPSDAFFNYVHKNNVKINAGTMSFAMSFNEHDAAIRDWIYERWASQELEIDVNSLGEIVTNAVYDNKTTYLDRIMQKIFDHVNVGNIITYVLIDCTYADDTDKIMIYASDSHCHYNNLLLLEIIKHYYVNNNPYRLRNKNSNLFKSEKDKIRDIIDRDKTALDAYKNIVGYMSSYNVKNYDIIMNHLSLFASIYYA
uniref:Uncharacterized protein n=1 Tax=viral metagenome TaxID=1070528 RepID=A0A6C0CA03_9ZZZZ